jgi:uncharacterized membrane protein YqjE
MDNETGEQILTLNSIIEYIRENFIGLLLLVLVVLIIYVIDHVNYLNSVVFTTPSPIIGVSNSIQNNMQKILPKAKKNKKR